MNLYIKNHLSSILLGVVFLCLYSCASFNLSKRSQNNRQSQIKGLQAFQEEDDPIDDGLEQTRSTNLFTIDQNDPRYYYTEYYEEYWGEELTPYNKLKGNLLRDAQTEILGIIRTEIKSVLIDKQLEINKNYQGIINSQIEARVEGVLTSDYYAFDVRPKLFEIKKGDILEVIARFDKVAHKEKLEIDKKDNEQLANDSFERAYDSYSKGIMYKCLEDMAL